MYVAFLILLNLVDICLSQKTKNTTNIDLGQCKVTQSGMEYRGSIGVTARGVRCQSWTGEKLLHKVNSSLTNWDFPDGSMTKAKNYCRNPLGSRKSPWCYTTKPELELDDCDIPLCNSGDCKISGTGAEYSGRRKVSASGSECQSWDINHKLQDGYTGKFPSSHFPEKSRHSAQKYCRNPDDDLGGPWCYVKTSEDDPVTKEYCDVPTCDDRDCLVSTNQALAYSTITKMNSSLGNVTFWMKLWNPADKQKTAALLLLSHLPIPTSSRRIVKEWKAGVEIVMLNFGSGLHYPNMKGDVIFERSPHILVGTKWTGVSIAWVDGLISVTEVGAKKPVFLEEYRSNNTISSLYPDGFLYYGLMSLSGSVLWSTELCQKVCEVHTTFGLDYMRRWPLHKINSTNDVWFYARANRLISIQLYQTPTTAYPCFTILIESAVKVKLMYQETAESMLQQLQEVSSSNLLNYWIWKEFVVTIIGSDLRIFLQKGSAREQIMYAKKKLFSTIRWFSIGSEEVIAHWTLFCVPETADAVKPALPPDCIANLYRDESKYTGPHWITINDKPCIPWSSDSLPEAVRNDDNFPNKSALRTLNQCRSLLEGQGPICFALQSPNDVKMAWFDCNIRTCKSTNCRMAGTGNDYIGSVSVTRSNRTCSLWVKPSGKSKKALAPVHPVNPQYLKDELFAERSAKNASNFCRDPSRSIAGPWCYTTDRKIPQDLCDVPDCDQPDQCMFFVKGSGSDRHLYVLPEHRVHGLRVDLKLWDADNPDTITLEFADDGLKSLYVLKVGALDNEKVLLYYQAEGGALELVMEKTLPHLLYIGKWSNFLLRIPRGSIQLYHDGSSTPIFEWVHPDPLKAFLPIYYHYTTELGHTVAVAFDCLTRCIVEMTETDQLTRILPVATGNSSKQELVLIIRGTGVVHIPLLLFPESEKYYCLGFSDSDPTIRFFMKKGSQVTKVYHASRSPASYVYTADFWTNITIRWFEQEIRVLRNGVPILIYKHSHALLLYFFSVLIQRGGRVEWAANCQPPDIDGRAVDGGWSEWGPWACSVSCNGGVGTRRRTCNNPAPNVRGEPCSGPDSMTGRCNTIRCGDITEDTVDLIRHRIQHTYTALTVDEGRAISIMADADVLARVHVESPDLQVRWSLNGIFLEPEKPRVSITSKRIAINRAEVNDSGVYSITLHRMQETHMILKVVTLVVYPVRTFTTLRETSSMSLDCHCAILGYLYANLRVAWLIDNKVWRDYGTTVPLSVDMDSVSSLNKSHRGRWECVIRQDDLKYRWITNSMMVKVIGAPNWKTHLMEDALTRPIFGWMPSETFVAVSVIIILVVSGLCVIGGTWWFLHFQQRRQPKGRMSLYDRIKNSKVAGKLQEEHETLIGQSDSEN